MTMDPQTDAQPARWSAVLAMTLCVFTLVASEFMPVSLLTPVASDLGVSEGLAGQAISISGAFAVLTSLLISRVAGNLDRRLLLLGMTAMMVLSAAMIAVAPSYGLYMFGRVFIGVAIGGFWSMSAATAIRLVPDRDVPRALAIFNGGNALAMVIAAPLGSYLAARVGWRGAFFCLVPVAMLAFAWQWISLPRMKRETRAARSVGVFGLLRNPAVAIGMAAVSVFFMGQFSLYTYVRPFLETVTEIDVSTLSLILLGTGVAGFVGTAVIGTFLKTGLYRPLMAIPVAMALIALALIANGRNTAAVAALLALWGLLGTAAPVGWWTWLARSLPQNAEAGGGLMVAVVQLAIALGSTVGGLVFDAAGYRSTFTLSAVLLLAAGFLAFLASRWESYGEQALATRSAMH